MKTIVKGKNIKVIHKRHRNNAFTSYYHYLDYSEIEEIQSIKYDLYELYSTSIISNEKIDSYETYFESDDINYRLAIGEKFNNDSIEAIEGTPEGDIIYYTEKELSRNDNKELENKLKQDLKDEIKMLEQKIETIRLQRKRWWQFWK